MRARFVVLTVVLLGLILAVVLYWLQALRQTGSVPASVAHTAADREPSANSAPYSSPGLTNVYAHNLMLRKGANFRFYVRWLRGHMVPAKRGVNPSFDEPESFLLDVQTGVLRANIGDLVNFLNASGMQNSPLKNLAITGDGNQVRLRATVHKVVPLPIQMDGTLSVGSGNRIQVHVNKISVLKIPFKALLGEFHVTIADLFQPKGIEGIEVTGNDIFFDTVKLLPAPHIRGQLTTVRIANPDIEEVFGNAQEDVARVEQWRNFIRLRDGTIDFGKLTMHHVDLIMIDISKNYWFEMDLNNYQAQLVNGYTRMTPAAGLQIFMPDVSKLPVKATQGISIQWMKNRNLAPPADVSSPKH